MLNQEERTETGASGGGPLLSVIIPVYNSSGYLRRCLAALAGSNYSNYEALVVDDGSTEPIREIVEEFGYGYVRIDGPGGPARARNHGARMASGRVLVFIDADVCVADDVLGRFAAHFAGRNDLAAVIGSYDESPADPNFLSQYKNLFHHYVHQQSDGPINTFWSGCGAIDREIFLKFGGFDQERYRRPAIEDIELGTWISAAGHPILLDSRIRAKHLKKWTLVGLCRTDILDRGIPWTRLMLRAGEAANTLNVTTGQRISVVLVYLTLMSAAAGFFWRPAWGMAALAALVVTVINFEQYRYFAARRGWWFAARTIPLHWLYFGYCGVSVALGMGLHYLRMDARQDKGRLDVET